MNPPHAPGRARAVDAATGLVLAAVLLAGLSRPGYPLLRDMVSTPRPPLGDAALGLGGSAARAVPQDVVTALGARVLGAFGLPDSLLLAALATGSFVWAALGAGALVRRVWPAAGARRRVPAIVVALWNPWVVERLLQGHWSLLAGLAACLAIPALLCVPRPGPSRRRVAAALACLLAAGITPTGWLLALVVTLASLAGLAAAQRVRPRPVLVPAVLLAALVGAGPWLLATVLGGASAAGASGADGVAAFAARAEPGVGTAGATLALGGIWNSQAVPASRTGWWVPVALVLWLLVAVVGARVLWAARWNPAVAALVPLGPVTWAAVVLAATGPGLHVLGAVVEAVPGGGLVRDTQKLLALAAPAWVLVTAAAAGVLGGPAPLRRVSASTALVLVAIASVADAPAELWRQFTPTRYGAGWAEARRITAGPDTVLVLPGGTFRATSLWAGGRVVLDPAPRLLDAPVAVTGDLPVGGVGPAPGGSAGAGAVSGEDGRARELYRLLLAGADPSELTARGVRWVLDERTSAGPRGESARTLAGARVAHADDELVLHELPGPVASAPVASSGARRAVLAAHLAWGLATVAAAAAALVGPGARRRGARRGRTTA